MGRRPQPQPGHQCVDRAVVIAKLSSWPTPLDHALEAATLALADAASAACG